MNGLQVVRPAERGEVPGIVRPPARPEHEVVHVDGGAAAARRLAAPPVALEDAALERAASPGGLPPGVEEVVGDALEAFGRGEEPLLGRAHRPQRVVEEASHAAGNAELELARRTRLRVDLGLDLLPERDAGGPLRARRLREGAPRRERRAGERLGIAARTAQAMARLARELRSRPLLHAAVRSGEVSVRKASAVLPVARGADELRWVERARHQTVRQLEVAVREETAGSADREDDGDEDWERIAIPIAGVVAHPRMAGRSTRSPTASSARHSPRATSSAPRPRATGARSPSTSSAHSYRSSPLRS